ncbi:bifunctional [glutamine synthetase] adenylyltransferase/[glutamine synthetase]-adenylyl-L-tyrosine phosphorylase [Roseiterribacter gracilis]|uniref:Bifunctional glutamine synthetase adenylyltransferase/adenylyl-removing enzyme n=1 Tax=Roseiterribacter gracilis TaxID=2812848 RepID=A0A8S8XHT9_9PROT|nr:glutamate-ammonia-ligase adenylyltransferase [Rhodospirillales bacterium TMPK1]
MFVDQFDPTRLPRPYDSEAVARARAGFAETPSLAALGNDPRALALLDGITGCSPHLTHALFAEADFVRALFATGPDAAFEAALAVLDETDGDSTADVMRRVRVAKRRAQLAVALADLSGAWTVDRVCTAISDVAETLLDRAAAEAARQAGLGPGLIVLGMGKLGGRELNYSSDVDLIVLYDADRLGGSADPDTLQKRHVRLTRELVRIMEERTADGYGFRCDLRLRPDPAATPLAVSVAAAEVYYTSLGQNWERAAMLKARPVAGDRAAGADFLERLQPWIWRRHLDFAAIQDIHSIKRQIDAGRPRSGADVGAAEGTNVKLGRGGIREIEFFAQVQQLIFGGRIPSLRAPATLPALVQLAAHGRIDETARDELTDAYRFLRMVEHRLQMVDDRQTHAIPDSAAGVAQLAAFCGLDEAAFREQLAAHRAAVERCYAHLFESAPTLAGPGNLVFTGTSDDPDTIATLAKLGFADPSRVAGIVRGWHHGRIRATRSQRARELLTELVPALLAALGRQPRPDDAFAAFDGFFASLPAGVQLLALFQENPSLLELVAEILGGAPRLAAELARDPSLLDGVLTQDFFGELPDRAAIEADLAGLLSRARDFEASLDAVRRFAAETRFRAGAQILKGLTDGVRAGRYLADTAEVAIQALLPRVEESFVEKHGKFDPPGVALLALGRLGGRRMSVASDLDLIVVYPPLAPDEPSDGPKPLFAQTYFARLTQRIVAALTAPTAAGKLYDVDLRLRPQGDKGPLATSLDSFRAYHADGAWTWERMALTRARVVAGPKDLADATMDAVREALTRPRDPQSIKVDVQTMRALLEREKPPQGAWDVKYADGGLVDIEFATQYLLLRHAPSDPSLLLPETEEALIRLAQAGHLSADAARDLTRTLDLCWRVQGYLRLAVTEKFDPATAPPSLAAGVARAVLGPESGSVDIDDAADFLRARLHAANRRCRAIFEQ